MKKLIAVISIVFCLGSAYAQDPQFSQFYANSLYLNPAFTGNTAQARLATTYRNQWPSIPKGYVSYTAAFDYNVEKIKSGLGLLITHDKAGEAGLNFTNIAGLYSSYIRVNRLTFIKAGFKFSYTSRGVNESELLFSDQIIRDGAPISVETISDNVNHFDLGTGLLLTNTEKYWVGVSFDHVNQPEYSFFGTNSFLPIKTSVHAGWNFEVKSSNVKEANEIKAMVHYKTQGKWDQLDIGAHYSTDPIFMGLWYRGLPYFKNYENEDTGDDFPNNESMIVLFGVKTNDLSIGYSYDITISKLSRNSGGAHEISLIYEMANPNKKRKNRRYFRAPCPKF